MYITCLYLDQCSDKKQLNESVTREKSSDFFFSSFLLNYWAPK